MIKEYIKHIIEKGNKEDMKMLEDSFEDAMEYIEEHNENLYKKIEDKLYIACYGKNLTEDKAKEIVRNMEPYGCKWSLEETRQVQNEYGLNDIKDIDFYVVMNSAYNDYHDLFDENLDMYVKYAKHFIKDEDAVENKVFEYFTRIAKKN